MNVYEASIKRIERIFNDFENVLVAFSGGKDSGICINLCYKYAKEHNLLHKLAVYHEDYEGGFPQTFEYIERVFDAMPEIKRYWFCLPIKAACSVSMLQTAWIPWDEEDREIWIRRMPQKPYVYNMENIWFPFKKGTSGFDFRILFANYFAQKHGKTAVIIGIRCDESLARLAIITSKHRVNMYGNLRYSKVNNDITVNFYPIYDWTTGDVWIANARFGFDYNRLYDLYYQAGLNISEMRTASPFHACGQEHLKLFRIICPDTWGRMVSRVNGVNFTAIYGGTTAMGWKNIKKPAHFTWKQYAEFLIETLPENTKKRLLYHLDRLSKSWRDEGYGRNPDVIKTMKEEGIVLEETGKISKLCTKDNIYQIVKIKSGFPDDTKISDFRHCPSWKSVCITVMKNDFTCQYLGCSRTREDMQRRKNIIEKYNKLL